MWEAASQHHGLSASYSALYLVTFAQVVHRISVLCSGCQRGSSQGTCCPLWLTISVMGGQKEGGCSAGRRWQVRLEWRDGNRESLNAQDFPELRHAPGEGNVM